jgi:hypothetical protein
LLRRSCLPRAGVFFAPFLHRVLRRMRVTDEALVENL